ncbi:MAG: ammonium transporter [Chloroflexi bacterium]|uniref:ammonium transporter n=1 Tax=Candidatus Flexifilum breve TaxID=3140694 RepID=UPI003136CF74|nr:ammonium transporter [Chloroflexota bacterium]MBK9749514.1 ammonium transporter [Chloroflexota bacterium]
MFKRNRIWRQLLIMGVATLVLAVFGMHRTFAQGEVTTPTMEDITSIKIGIDTAWVMLTGFLVFFMQLGFAILETGMIRQTAAVNGLLENFLEAGVGALVWWLVGFGLAFGADNGSGLFGTTLFAPGIELADTIFYGNISTLTMFFFQFAFAATASTITTGAMAERTDFVGNLIYTVIVTAIIYPVVVHWVWGGGWLFQQGFFDFAGSNVVHTVGGVIAIIGAWMLGPRKGKVWGKAIPPHNLGLALTGTMILWVGWYGFNPGSTLGAVGVGGTIGIVVLNTTLGGGIGSLSAMFFQYFRTGKWDLTATLNGSLAGLVAVTAGCAFVSPLSAIIIGGVAGIILLLWGDLLEKIKVDDAVGASSVHLACGVWGILALGLFAEPTLTPFAANVKAGFGGLLVAGGSADILITQIIGSAATIAWVGVTSVLMFGALKAVKRLRVNPKAEADGNTIDNYEHGQSIWPDILPLPGDSPVTASVVSGAKAPAAGD